MKITEICSMLLGVAILVCMISSIVSAQYTPDMLGGKWFKVKVSWTGYYGYVADEITGTRKGSDQIYMYVTYHDNVDDPIDYFYTLTTCSQDKSGNYSPDVMDGISRRYIYGSPNQRQFWDLTKFWRMVGPYLQYHRIDNSTVQVVPVFIMDVKLYTNNTFKNAKFKSLACFVKDHSGGDVGIFGEVGNCSLSGKTIDASKVPQSVLEACGP